MNPPLNAPTFFLVVVVVTFIGAPLVVVVVEYERWINDDLIN